MTRCEFCVISPECKDQIAIRDKDTGKLIYPPTGITSVVDALNAYFPNGFHLLTALKVEPAEKE